MDATSWLEAVLLLACLVLSGLASASETALTAVSRIRMKQLAEEGNRRAKEVDRLLKDPARYLTTILAVNNVAVIVASSVTTVLAIRLIPQWGEVIATVLLSVVVLIFAEITPKTLAVQNAERAALFCGGFVSAASYLLGPVLAVLGWVSSGTIRLFGGQRTVKNPFVTEEQLRMLVTVGEEEGILEETEKEMIHSIFEFGDTVVREVMKPRVDIVGIEADAPFDEVVRVAIEAGHSRIPVYRESLDHILGVLYVRDLVAAMRPGHEVRSVTELMREPLFVPETMKVDDLFRDMQRRKIHMAIVLDEYGGTAGLVTIEDLLEEIVGDIQDEYDVEEPEVEKVGDGTYVVDARLSIDSLNDLLGTEIEAEDVDSVGGLVISHLGRLPEEHDKVTVADDVELEVLQLEGHTIRRVKAVRHAKHESEAAPVEEREA